MELSYRRISTSHQNTARQLVGVDIDRDFVDIASGKNIERPQLKALLQMVRAGDVIHVHELSRLGRSVKDLLEIVEHIVNLGASVRFYKENLIFSSDTKNSFQSLMLNLLASIAEFERALLLERQMEGIQIAKQLGKFTGKKSRFTLEELNQIKEEFKSTKSKKKLAEKLGISRSYLYELIKHGHEKQLRA